MMVKNIESMNENYTFTKDTYVNEELESSVTYEFNNKNNIDKLTAVKTDGEEISSGDDIEFHLREVLEEIIELTEKRPKTKVKAVVSDEEEKIVKLQFPKNDDIEE